jgi:dethiobiotin synthetase
VKQIFFITGTDTGAGKTVLTALLTQFLRARKINVAALKPICSGGRDDARKIFAALNGALTLDEINPWHFHAPMAPTLAAKMEKKSVKLPQVVAHVRAMQKRFDVLLIEGAGGLLSPLGEKFDSRDLISALRATPITVAQNKLGAVNHILLTLEALPKNARSMAKIVLMSPPKPDAVTRSNAKLLEQFLAREKILSLPWLGKNFGLATAWKIPQARRALDALAI